MSTEDHAGLPARYSELTRRRQRLLETLRPEPQFKSQISADRHTQSVLLAPDSSEL